MDIDYSLLLLVLVLVSGVIWLFDALVLAGPRRQRFETFAQAQGLRQEDFDSLADLPRNQAPQGRAAAAMQAARLQQEPVAVEYAKSFFPVLLLVFLLRSFLFEPFQIPSGSMIPTLEIGDFILVNKYAYGVRLPVLGTQLTAGEKPKRGDVMVFVPPHDSSYFIKRVIGLPGDHVRYEDKVLYINGEAIPQDFLGLLRDNNPPAMYYKELLGESEHEIYTATTPRYPGRDFWLQAEGRVIPDGHYFMMGDNRDNSDDSRRWGPVPEENIVGKAVAVWMHKEPGFSMPSFSGNRWLNQ